MEKFQNSKITWEEKNCASIICDVLYKVKASFFLCLKWAFCVIFRRNTKETFLNLYEIQNVY